MNAASAALALIGCYLVALGVMVAALHVAGFVARWLTGRRT